MILFSFLSYMLKTKVLALFFALGLIVLAAAEATDNHTLIIISLITNGTLFVGMIISALISLHNARKLGQVAAVPGKIEELRISLDGRLQELMKAREGMARAEGVQQERGEERDRGAENRDRKVQEPPAKVEVVNPKSNPVPTTPIKPLN